MTAKTVEATNETFSTNSKQLTSIVRSLAVLVDRSYGAGYLIEYLVGDTTLSHEGRSVNGNPPRPRSDHHVWEVHRTLSHSLQRS